MKRKSLILTAVFAAILALTTGCIGRRTATSDAEPARRIVCMSSSHVAFLSELGAADRVVGVSGAGFISDSLVAAGVAAGSVAEVGWAGNYDLETIISLAPDLVLTNSAPGSDDAGGQDSELVSRLVGMGIRCFGVGDWLEATPLGRAGWIVPIAELCGLTQEGEARFEEIKNAYNELAARAAEFAATHAHRPEVMLNAPYRDVWYAPGDDSYMIRLIRDAGGEWVCRGTSGTQSRPIDIEQAYVAMERAEVWLNTNHYSTMAELLADNPRFAATPPVVSGRVYNNNARMTAAGGSDFWESAVVRPDVVLRDLITILHPEALLPDAGSLPDAGADTLYYYKKLE